jgi:hypothetical protein
VTPIHPEFEPELLRLARKDVSYAEAWRALIPVAQRLDRRRPTYDAVRRFIEAERERLREVAEHKRRQQDRIVAPLLVGRIPRPY